MLWDQNKASSRLGNASVIHHNIANKTCVLQIAPVCMTENLGTKNLTLKVIVCSRILSVYPSNTQSLT